MTSSRDIGVRRLNLLLKRALEPVFLLNAERTLVYVNPAWEALTGQSTEVVLGLDACRTIRPATATWLAWAAASALLRKPSKAGLPGAKPWSSCHVANGAGAGSNTGPITTTKGSRSAPSAWSTPRTFRRTPRIPSRNTCGPNCLRSANGFKTATDSTP